jgi:tetratricopeptide (TPR) repeat protein
MSSEIDQLAQEAAGELGRLEKMLDAAREAAAADFQASPNLDAALEKFEKSLEHLPERSSGALGPMAEAASAREQGEATLDALRAGDLAEAVERGLETDAALKRVQKSLDSGPSWLSPAQIDQTQKALKELMSELKSAREELDRSRQARTDGSLGERGEKQKAFAERAEALAKKGTSREAPLGEEGISSLKKAAELLRKAAQMMDSGQAEPGARYAQEAQEQLERALPSKSEQGSEGAEPSEGEPSSQGTESSKGSVPEEEKDRAGEFRRRVEEGLGRHGGALAPAIRRYAEDLK